MLYFMTFIVANVLGMAFPGLFLLVKKRYLVCVYYDSVVFIYLCFHCLDVL